MSTKLQPTPLPSNPYSPTTHPSWHAAFNACIPLERAASWTEISPRLAAPSTDAAMLQTSPQVAGRTLGYALIHAPNDAARDCVAREINGCEHDPEILAGLAHVYVFGLVRIFMNLGGPTPMEESPRYPFAGTVEDDDDDDEGAAHVVPAGTTPRSLTNQVLPRDRYRCVFTGKLDFESLYRGVLDPSTPGRGDYLSVVHIASQLSSGPNFGSVCGMTEAAQDKLRWASSTAAVLDRLAGIQVHDVLPDLNIDHPANTLMAASAPHTMFDRLELWLTPSLDDEGNMLTDTYDTHVRHPLLAQVISLPPQIRFRHCTAPGGVDVPPPSKALLEIHAACAKVAHLSGAAEVLEALYGEDGVLRG